MALNTEFIGRAAELGLLRACIDSERPTIAVLYGRRRIGKSSLIRAAFESRSVFFFEGLENQSKQHQIDNFLFQLALQTGDRSTKPLVKTWREAFFRLYEYLQQNPHHICLDEFQWMANYRSEIVSDLKMVWDQYLSTIKGTTLVLCGSIASFMIAKVVKSSALYGRTDCQIALKPFSQFETNLFLKEKGFAEQLEAHILTGGIPRYLQLVQDAPSVRLGMEKEAFTTSGYFVQEFDRIFVSHFGKNPEFEKIIRCLAAHPYGLYRKQLAEKLSIPEGGPLSDHLSDLETAGFISSKVPFFRDQDSRQIKYYLTDAYIRFYFAFIFPNLKKIASGLHNDIFARISLTPAFASWLGRSFEYACIQHTGEIARRLGFASIDYSAGPYFNPRDKTNSGVQIDLLFDRADKVITLCEMKYTLGPIGVDIIPEIEEKSTILAAKFPSRTIQKVLITLSNPSKELAASGYFYRIFTAQELFDGS